MEFLLTADVGGTRARFGLVPAGALKPSMVRISGTRDDPSFEAAAKRFLAEAGGARLSGAVIAWAGPIVPGPLRLTNGPWTFHREAFGSSIGAPEVVVINDFEAVAHSIAHLGPQDVAQVGGGSSNPSGVRAVLGPGTGLGTASVIPAAGGWTILPGEGGHTTAPVSGEAEFALAPHLFKDIEHPSAEHLLSGPGILRTYRAIAAARGAPVTHDRPEKVTAAAVAGTDPTAAAAFELFQTWLGRMAGDLALILNATGGVYIAGGIAPRFVRQLRSGPFRAAFEGKGPMSALARSIPAYLVTAELPALIGCAAVHRMRAEPVEIDRGPL